MKPGVLIGLVAIGIGAFWLLRGGKESIRDILDRLFPGGFTASYVQLDILEAAGYPQGGGIYEQAIDMAYQDALAACGPGEVVCWTEELGYHPCDPFY